MTEEIELSIQEKNPNAWRKGNLNILGKPIKHAEMKEKMKKEYQTESHQKDKYLGCPHS